MELLKVNCQVRLELVQVYILEACKCILRDLVECHVQPLEGPSRVFVVRNVQRDFELADIVVALTPVAQHMHSLVAHLWLKDQREVCMEKRGGESMELFVYTLHAVEVGLIAQLEYC